MRMKFAFVFFVQTTFACLPGFYGNDCNLCPANHKCADNVKQACPFHLMSFPGSRTCYTFSNFSESQFSILPVHGYAGLKNPSNASCGCFKVNTELAIIFELKELTRVFGIVTQGYELTWVKTFMLDASDDNTTWTPIGGLFYANNDDFNPIYIFFPFEIVTKFLKFSVVEYFLWPAVQLSFLTRVVPIHKCKPKVNMQLLNVENCTYVCKNGTYEIQNQCVSFPRHSMQSGNQSSFKVRHYKNPFDSKIHQFDSKVVLQTEKKLPNTVYLRYDNTHWNLIDVELEEGPIFNPRFFYYRLPMAHIITGLFIKYFNDGKYVSLNYGRAIIHDRTQKSNLKNQATISWGMGNTFSYLGDSMNLGFISCNNSELNFYNVSTNFDATQSGSVCATENYSFFEDNLELYGIRSVFKNYWQHVCLTKNGTFFISKTQRHDPSILHVEAYCKS